MLGSGGNGSEGSSSRSHHTNAGQTTARRRNKFAEGPALSEWGPSGPERDKGKGKQQSDMNAAVKQLKTASVMESHEGVNGGLKIPINKTRHKRRSSDDTSQHPGGSAETEGDTLVYIHHVLRSDTLAGVIVKYNVDPTIFRKANRLYPNDDIRIRKVVLVPVEASAVRGKPCDPPRLGQKGVDLLAPTPRDEEPPNLAEDTEYANGILSPDPSSYAPTPSQAERDEKEWVHVRWVLLSSSPNAQPTEVARLPRRALGYFPPRRRKNSQGMPSPFPTPRASYDFSSPAASPPGANGGRRPGVRRLSNLSSSFSNTSYFPSMDASNSTMIPNPRPLTGRARSSSRPTAMRSTSGNGPESWFRGPGGVGTFAANVRKPGPANDGLNQFFRKHLPDFSMADLPSLSSVGPPVEEERISFGFKSEMQRLKDSALNGVNISGDDMPNGGTGSGEGGADLTTTASAIEGWVRKLGRQQSLTNLRPGTSRGRPEERMGDLIELLDGAGSDDGKGFDVSSAARAESNAVLNRRKAGKDD